MDTIVNFAVSNSAWFLVGAIIILLAIIGSYADKTNFGLGKKKEEEKDNKDLDKTKLVDEKKKEMPKPIEKPKIDKPNAPIEKKAVAIKEVKTRDNKNDSVEENNSDLRVKKNTTSENLKSEKTSDVQESSLKLTDDEIKEIRKIIENKNKQLSESVKKIEISEIKTQKRQEKLNKSFEELDKEFEELLPQKSVMDDDLMSEVDSLSFDKTQKIPLDDILNLDDLELPKLKKMDSIDEDIWKI